MSILNVKIRKSEILNSAWEKRMGILDECYSQIFFKVLIYVQKIFQ